MASYGNSYPHA